MGFWVLDFGFWILDFVAVLVTVGEGMELSYFFLALALSPFEALLKTNKIKIGFSSMGKLTRFLLKYSHGTFFNLIISAWPTTSLLVVIVLCNHGILVYYSYSYSYGIRRSLLHTR